MTTPHPVECWVCGKPADRERLDGMLDEDEVVELVCRDHEDAS